MRKILIVDDEEKIRELIRMNLELAGYKCDEAEDGEIALEKLNKFSPDLALLDIMLPKKNGYEIAQSFIKQNVPIIFLTAKDSVTDKVKGLKLGADDYIVKPFAIEELLARLRALLRRIDIEGDKNVAKQTTITYRDLTIEKENRVVRRNSEMIELTKREYELLLTLMENVNVVLARDVLLNKVWGYETEVETNVVDVYIRYLRNKIDVPGEESYIQTVRGTGYVMRSWELINEKND